MITLSEKLRGHSQRPEFAMRSFGASITNVPCPRLSPRRGEIEVRCSATRQLRFSPVAAPKRRDYQIES